MSKTSIRNISYKYDYEEIGAQIHNYMEIIYVLSGRLAKRINPATFQREDGGIGNIVYNIKKIS